MRQIITTSITPFLAVWMLVAQPALSQTNENPLTSREFWAEMNRNL